jgi:protein involved in polysaccharide export with SLBB domain
MRFRFRVRTLMVLTSVFALLLAWISPDVYESWRRASACYVVGDVVRPGRLETLGVKLTVQDAIKAAGGLMPNAHRAKIRLVRPSSSGNGEKILTVDLSRPDTNHILKPGDPLVILRNRNN